MTHAACSWTGVHEIEKHIPFSALAMMSSYIPTVKLWVCALKNGHINIISEKNTDSACNVISRFQTTFHKNRAATSTAKQDSFHAKWFAVDNMDFYLLFVYVTHHSSVITTVTRHVQHIIRRTYMVVTFYIFIYLFIYFCGGELVQKKKKCECVSGQRGRRENHTCARACCPPHPTEMDTARSGAFFGVKSNKSNNKQVTLGLTSPKLPRWVQSMPHLNGACRLVKVRCATPVFFFFSPEIHKTRPQN